MANIISSKNQAIVLRKQGKSYNEINKLLGTPKSTLSTWLKDLPLSIQIKQKNIKQTKIIWAKNIVQYNRLRSLKYQKSREKIIHQYSQEIPELNKEIMFWLGLGLFWAEGSKREKSSVRFANSDPDIIRLMMQFFSDICQISKSKFRFQLSLHPNVTDENAQEYWKNLLKCSEKQFYKSQITVSKSSKYKRKHNQLPYGTLHIYIGDSLLNKKIKGWIKGVALKI
jgi:hypothetical protein